MAIKIGGSNLIKEAIGFGTTVEEAYEAAKNNLCDLLLGTKYNEEDIEYDVLATPKKKTLGLFGGVKAEVKAYITLPDEKKPDKPKKEKIQKAEKKIEKKAVKADEKIEKKEKVETVSEQEAAAVDAGEIAPDSRAGQAVKYISTVLEKLGCTNIAIKVAEKENGAVLYLSGEGLGVVIGRRGETLDSLQYLTSLAANSASGYYKVTLNIGNYRERREQTLTSLARRVSAQVLRTGRNRTLEPMNPYERRIIHTAVQEIEGVTSHSVGEGSGRRVVISSEKGARRNSRPNKAVQNTSDVVREPKRDTEIPLYGKIN